MAEPGLSQHRGNDGAGDRRDRRLDVYKRQAVHREEREKKKSVMEQLKSQPKTEHKRQRKKRAQKGSFDMNNFTFEETNLLCIYKTGSRTGLIDALTEMRGELSPEEAELRELTDSALGLSLIHI